MATIPSLYKWFIESFIQTIHSKQRIHLEMKQVAVYMNGWLNHSKQMILSKELIQATVFMNGSLTQKVFKKQINSGIKQHGVSLRCTNVLLQLCLELFSSVKQKKQTLLCLKCNSIDINILFVELLSKMITFANALTQIFRKTALLLVWYYINVISYKNKNTTAHTGIFVAFIEAF